MRKQGAVPRPSMETVGLRVGRRGVDSVPWLSWRRRCEQRRQRAPTAGWIWPTLRLTRCNERAGEWGVAGVAGVEMEVEGIAVEQRNDGGRNVQNWSMQSNQR